MITATFFQVSCPRYIVSAQLASLQVSTLQSKKQRLRNGICASTSEFFFLLSLGFLESEGWWLSGYHLGYRRKTLPFRLDPEKVTLMCQALKSRHVPNLISLSLALRTEEVSQNRQ